MHDCEAHWAARSCSAAENEDDSGIEEWAPTPLAMQAWVTVVHLLGQARSTNGWIHSCMVTTTSSSNLKSSNGVHSSRPLHHPTGAEVHIVQSPLGGACDPHLAVWGGGTVCEAHAALQGQPDLHSRRHSHSHSHSRAATKRQLAGPRWAHCLLRSCGRLPAEQQM